MNLAEAEMQRSAYRASDPNTTAILQTIDLIPLVGPAAIGKNYFMQRSGFAVPDTITSRAPRASDKPGTYRYLTNEEIFGLIEKGQLVQYAVNQQAGTIYATDAPCYEAGVPNIMDTFSTAVEDLRHRGFKRVLPVGIVAPPEIWKLGLNERFDGATRKFCSDRLEEAAQSIRWILNDTIPKLVVINDRRHNEDVIDQIDTYIATGDTPPISLDAHRIAKAMLQAIPKFRAQYAA